MRCTEFSVGCCCCLVTRSCLTLLQPYGLLQGNLPDPGIKPVSLELAGGFLITEPPGKPKFPVRSAVFHFIHDAKKRTLNMTLKKCLQLWKTCPEVGGMKASMRSPWAMTEAGTMRTPTALPGYHGKGRPSCGWTTNRMLMLHKVLN